MNYEMMSDVELYKLMRSGDMKAGLLYARKAYEKNEYEECLQIAREMDDTEIEDMECLKEKWELLGQAYLKLGEIEDASYCFETARELHSEDAVEYLLQCELEGYKKKGSLSGGSRIISDKDLAFLEEKALSGDGALSVRIGQLYGYRGNKARQRLYFDHAKECGYNVDFDMEEAASHSSGTDEAMDILGKGQRLLKETAEQKREQEWQGRTEAARQTQGPQTSRMAQKREQEWQGRNEAQKQADKAMAIKGIGCGAVLFFLLVFLVSC